MYSPAEVAAILAGGATFLTALAALVGQVVKTVRARRVIASASLAADQRASTPVIGAQTDRPRVLLVDDEASFGKVVRRSLLALGYEVDWAGSAEEALRLAERHSYIVVIADFHLPGMNGLILLDKLRPRTVLFSGSFVGDGTDAQRIGADGRVDAVLAKGGDLAELCEVVRELAAQTGKRAKPSTK